MQSYKLCTQTIKITVDALDGTTATHTQSWVVDYSLRFSLHKHNLEWFDLSTVLSANCGLKQKYHSKKPIPAIQTQMKSILLANKHRNYE